MSAAPILSVEHLTMRLAMLEARSDRRGPYCSILVMICAT